MGKIGDEAKQLWETYPQLRPGAMKKEESKNETVKLLRRWFYWSLASTLIV